MTDALTPLSVLARPAFTSIHNPYNAMIYGDITRYGVHIEEFSDSRAVLKRFDAIHVHWPETIFNGRHLHKALVRTEKLLWLLRWQRRRGAKVIWTVHNLKAHDSRHKVFEERFWRAYPNLVDGFITLRGGAVGAIIERFPKLSGRPHWIIPHPHYRGQYPDDTDRAVARERLGLAANAHTILFIGQLRPYKNVPTLIRAFRSLRDRPDRRFQLVIAGAPRDQMMAELLEREAGGDPRIRQEFRFIESDDLQYYLRASDLVVLPYREILNSGSALLALSFDRPVLLPRSGCEADLAEAVPRPWILNYDELTSSELESALLAVEVLPERTDGTHLARFAPSRVTAATAAAFREFVTSYPPGSA